MEAKVRHLWGFSATWWKVMPMHNAWGEREDFVWLLFIDHQSSATAHTRLSQPPHLMRCNLSQIKKAGAEEKQESSKLPTLSRIKKRKKQQDETEMLTCYFQTAGSFDAQTKRREAGGKREQRGWCLSQRWALTKCFIHVILHALPSSLFLPFQHFCESVFRSSWEKKKSYHTRVELGMSNYLQANWASTFGCRLCKPHLLPSKVWSYFLLIPLILI